MESKTIKRLLILVVLLLMIGSSVLLAIRTLKGDKIKQLFVTEINKHLTVKVSLGDADITFLRSFPHVSLDLFNIAMEPPAGLKDATGLLHARKVSLYFNVMDLFSGKYIIHRVLIDNASFSIWEDANGLNNLQVWKMDSAASSQSVDFNIKRIDFVNTGFFYTNLKRNDKLAFDLKDVTVRGSINSALLKLKVKGDLMASQIVVGGTSMVPPGELTLDAQVDIDTKIKQLDFKKSALLYAGVPVNFNGQISYSDHPEVNLNIASEGAEIKRILPLLPAELIKPYLVYDPSGKLTFQANLSGMVSHLESMSITSTFNLTQGGIRYNGSSVGDIKTSGSFKYQGKKNSEVLALNDFSASTKNSKMKGSIWVSSFSNPLLKLDIKADADLAELAAYLKEAPFSNVSGRIVADVRYNGQPKSDTRMDQHTHGQVSFQNAGFAYSGKVIRELNGSLELREEKIYFDGLACKLGESHLKANGYITNLISHILNHQHNIYASLNLYSKKLKLEDIMELAGETSDQKTPERLFPPYVSFDAVLNVDGLTYKKLTTENLSGTFSLKNELLRGENIQIAALGGNITAAGIINARYGNRAQIISKATFKNVDVNRFFYEFNEFGQQGLVSSNLKGKANVTIDFSTSLYNDLTVNPETIEAIADIEIFNGELNDFEPLQALSRFVDKKELNNVKFATMKNRIEISRKTVVIPRMEINSSALNLVGYGTHTFGNDIDYHVNMLISDLMGSKRSKKSLPEYSIEDDGLGKPRLFLKLSGPVNDPLVQYDTRAVAKKISDDFKKEKQVFREVINKEFGFKNKEQDKGTPALEPKTSPKFDIEWDEDK